MRVLVLGRRGGRNGERLVSAGGRTRRHRARAPAWRGARDQPRQRRPGFGQPLRAMGQSRRAAQDPEIAREGRRATALSPAARAEAVAVGTGLPAGMPAASDGAEHPAARGAWAAQPADAGRAARRARPRVRPPGRRDPPLLHRRARFRVFDPIGPVDVRAGLQPALAERGRGGGARARAGADAGADRGRRFLRGGRIRRCARGSASSWPRGRRTRGCASCSAPRSRA